MSSQERQDQITTDKMEKEIQKSKRHYVVYQVNGDTTIDFLDYRTLSNVIKNAVKMTLPNEEEFNVYTSINSCYNEKGKGRLRKKTTTTNLTIKIDVDDTKNHKEEFSKIKENLEKILDNKLKVLKEKH